MLTVTAAALMLAATSLAVGESKSQAPFTRSVKVVRIHTNAFPSEFVGLRCCL
jgi:hypothetical protein